MAEPIISVLLPVYNAERFVADSLSSILEQTFSDFEVIVIDDGSKDRSAEIISGFSDPRIRFYRQENSGMGVTLNKAISLAKGKYLARQDADDISLPGRFKEQVDFLESKNDFALIGSWSVIANEQLVPTGRMHQHPLASSQLRYDLLFDNPFVHTSVMIRASALKVVGPYDLSIDSLIQDYELWWRIANKFNVGNIGLTLVIYREVISGMSRSEKKFGEVVSKQSMANILSLLKRDRQELQENEIELLEKFCLLYHSCYSALGQDLLWKELKKMETRIQSAANHFEKDFDPISATAHVRQLKRRWREYLLTHVNTPKISRLFLRLTRKFNP